MDIYKEHVIEALEDEPLGWQGWVSSELHEYNTPAKDLDCVVCAVGGVFRKFTTKTIDDIDNTIYYMSEGVGGVVTPYSQTERLPQAWLEVLSYVWESIFVRDSETPPVEEARAIMIDWVEDNVPEDVVLWEIS